MFYAQDPTHINEVLTALETMQPEGLNGHWLALVDTAFDYVAGRDVTALRKTYQHAVNCYAFRHLPDLTMAAPVLLPLAAPSMSENTVLDMDAITQLLKRCSGTPMLSFLFTRLDADSLARTWAARHQVKADDLGTMLLRFADTRVLPLLPSILTSQQWSALASEVECWLYIDRQGMPQCLPAAAKPAEAAIPWALSAKQLEAFGKAAEPDAMLQWFDEYMADVLPEATQRSQLYRWASEALNLVEQCNLQHAQDRQGLLLAAFLSAGRTTHSPQVHACLEQKSWQPGELVSYLADHDLVE